MRTRIYKLKNHNICRHERLNIYLMPKRKSNKSCVRQINLHNVENLKTKLQGDWYCRS